MKTISVAKHKTTDHFLFLWHPCFHLIRFRWINTCSLSSINLENHVNTGLPDLFFEQKNGTNIWEEKPITTPISGWKILTLFLNEIRDVFFNIWNTKDIITLHLISLKENVPFRFDCASLGKETNQQHGASRFSFVFFSFFLLFVGLCGLSRRLWSRASEKEKNQTKPVRSGFLFFLFF